MGRRKNKKKSHWSAYNSTDTFTDAGGTPGGPAFFHYHPGSSGMNQSWWFNTFGKQQDPPLDTEGDPFASTSSEVKNEVRNDFPLEPKSYDSKYREYRPPQRSPSPAFRPRPHTSTPPPPKGPSPEYIATSNDPSHSLDDPVSSRKLLVLDLNGTLLHRSPHSNKNGPRHPIPGQEGFQPRLRSVHPRPYLPSFKSYIFHPSNQGWLDVMVWSSAQPHTVHDMVNKCFHDEKDNFVAVWARDTLGLPRHLYTRKVQTIKDLSVPWSKLFASSRVEPNPHHNASTTLLMDDSPRKAELQPYNHLCVKEYSKTVRNRDLASLQEEKARLKLPSTPPPVEEFESQFLPPTQLPVGIGDSLIPSTIRQHPSPFELPPAPLDPSQEFQFDQSVGIQPGATLLNPVSNTGCYPGDTGLGQGVIAPQMLFKNPSHSMLGYQNPRAFQQFPQSINAFTPSQAIHRSPSRSHAPPTDSTARPTPFAQVEQVPLVEITIGETKASSNLSPPASPFKKRKRKEKKTDSKAPGLGPIHVIEYDETLLAIVGILDEVKFQSNVASWVKAGGFWGPCLPWNEVNPGDNAFTHDADPLNRGDADISSDSGSVGSGRHGEKRKRRDAVEASSEATVTGGPEGGDSPTDENQSQVNTSQTSSWFDNPPTMGHWVDQGKRALEALGIPIDHGLTH